MSLSNADISVVIAVITNPTPNALRAILRAAAAPVARFNDVVAAFVATVTVVIPAAAPFPATPVAVSSVAVAFAAVLTLNNLSVKSSIALFPAANIAPKPSPLFNCWNITSVPLKTFWSAISF